MKKLILFICFCCFFLFSCASKKIVYKTSEAPDATKLQSGFVLNFNFEKSKDSFVLDDSCELYFREANTGFSDYIEAFVGMHSTVVAADPGVYHFEKIRCGNLIMRIENTEIVSFQVLPGKLTVLYPARIKANFRDYNGRFDKNMNEIDWYSENLEKISAANKARLINPDGKAFNLKK